MNFYIIGISGKQHAGKSTLAQKLNDDLKGGFRTAHIVKFAQPLYDLAAAFNKIMGVSPLFKDGTFMQLAGNHARTKYGENIFVNAWIDSATERVKAHMAYNDHQFLICDDLRFDNEAAGLRAFADKVQAKCILVRLECSENERRERSPETWRESTTHPSEIGLDDFNGFDLTFDTSKHSVATIAAQVKKALGVP